MTIPKDTISGAVKVFRTEDVTLYRQHVLIEWQDKAPEVIAELIRTMQIGKATGKVHIVLNQGGVRHVESEQVTKTRTRSSTG